MQRRRNSKSVAKQQYQELVQRSKSKKRKNQQVNERQAKFNQLQKRVKENLMFSLIEVFHEYRNEPSLIHPWMKEFHQLEQRIIGTNYIIVGPSQSGKYSAVKFALGEYYPDVHQILINCEVCTTEVQFVHKLLTEFRQKAPKCDWPRQEKDINKLITNDSIDFEKLNSYIKNGDFKFVIVIKNGEHLVGFKKQTILYNLFEWMRSCFIQERGGLVILTRKLMFIDRFEKRVRSRFQGNRLTIFRPTQPQIYMKIITKRIQAVIKDKETWYEQLKLRGTPIQVENDVYDSDQQTNTRKKPKQTIGQKGKQVNVQEFMELQQKYKYVKQICDYSKILTQYLDKGFDEMGLQDFFHDKIAEFYQSSNKEEMRLYSDQSILSVQEQIVCLKKIKKALEKSKSISHYFKQKILQNQIITIPFVLRIFQHIFLTIEQSIIKELATDKLELLILKLLEKNVQFQFPINVIQSNSLESLSNVQLLLLIFIYKMIYEHISPIRLTVIHNLFSSALHQTIHQEADHESNKIPTRFIEQSIDRLYRSGIISYSPYNIWNCEISLLIQMQKIRKGLEHLGNNKHNLPDIIKKQLKKLHIISDKKQSDQ